MAQAAANNYVISVMSAAPQAVQAALGPVGLTDALYRVVENYFPKLMTLTGSLDISKINALSAGVRHRIEAAFLQEAALRAAPFIPAPPVAAIAPVVQAAQPVAQAAIAQVISQTPWLNAIKAFGGIGAIIATGVAYKIYTDPNWLKKIQNDVIEPAKKIVEENKVPDAYNYIENLIRKVQFGQQMAYPIQLEKIILPDKPFDVPEPLLNPGSSHAIDLYTYIYFLIILYILD